MSYDPNSAPPKPNNNLAWSLVTLLACCMPLGIVSLVYSMKVDTLYFQGQYKEAQEKADLAKKWAIGGIITSLVGILLYFGFFFVYFLILVLLGVSTNY